MKDYTDYMDNISVDLALHDKIMKRATQKSVPLYRNRMVNRFAGLTACAVVLMLCVLTIPGLFNAPTPNIPDNLPGVTSSNIPDASTPSVIITDTTLDTDADTITSGLRDEECPLTLNKADTQLGADRAYVSGHFWYDLTDEQLSAVFPNLSLSLIAVAHYSGDGSLYNVMAYEASAEGAVSFYNDYYRAATIEIVGADGWSMEDVIYEYEPTASDVFGIPVVAGVFDFKANDGIALYIAKFNVGDVSYNIKLHDDDSGSSGANRLTQIVNDIIYYGTADLSVLSDPVIPELRDDMLNLKEARSDIDFGRYLPNSVPSRFSFESARRFINQETNSLSVNWYAGLDYIHWSVSKPTEYDRELIVYASEQEKYDLSLYPIPRADSVPSELREYVDNPVFLAEELTLDVVKARVYQINDAGDTPGWRMNFSVLYDDAVIKVYVKGATPEQVWEMFKGIPVEIY